MSVQSEALEEYKNTGMLTNKVMMEATLAKCYAEGSMDRLRAEVREYHTRNKKVLLEISDKLDKIHGLVHDFEKKHWNTYLKKYWNDSKDRGHIVEVGDLEVLMWGSAGRVLLTLQKGKDNFTMIFSDYVPDGTEHWRSECTGGMQGIDCTAEVAAAMLNKVIAEKTLEFKVKNSVTVAGL
jgi:hypothetical protein